MDFDEWIISIFGPLERQPQEAYWDGPETTIIEYMTRLFAEADTVLAPYSDTQAEQGLWAMVSQYHSHYPFLLTELSVPLPARLACVEAMDSLFSRFFARRCSPHLSHLDTVGKGTPADVSPLNGLCYIWWDVIPLGCLSTTDWTAIQQAMQLIFRHCLESDSIACQESALLGLMNWEGTFDDTPETEAVMAVARRVLRRKSGAWPALRAFTRC